MIGRRSTKILAVVLLGSSGLLLLGAIAPSSQSADGPPQLPATKSQAAKSSANDSAIAHGKYLVHHVAQCIECHTPRNERGELLRERLLTGAPIPVSGPKYAAPWAAESASLAGLGTYDESFIRYLLTHGQKPDGSKPKSPMPSFHLTKSDAEAVIAYLRSL